MTNPALSVVMTVFNAEAYIDAAIGSIRAQSFQDFEFIIVHDGSTDGTAARLARHAQEDRRITVHSQENRGIIHSANRGLSMTSGHFVARMDGDDVAAPTRFERQLQLFKQAPKLVAVGSAYNEIDETGQVLRPVFPPAEHAAICSTLERTNCIAQSSVMMRRDAVMAVGSYRRAFVHAEDYDLWVRLAEIGEIANLPDLLLNYRIYPRQRGIDFVEQRALGEVGVRASAMRRRSGLPDPTTDADLVTRDLLHALGVERETVDFEVMRRALQAARRAAKAGDRKLRDELLALARRQNLTGAWRNSYYWFKRLQIHI